MSTGFYVPTDDEAPSGMDPDEHLAIMKSIHHAFPHLKAMHAAGWTGPPGEPEPLPEIGKARHAAALAVLRASPGMDYDTALASADNCAPPPDYPPGDVVGDLVHKLALEHLRLHPGMDYPTALRFGEAECARRGRALRR